jgi:hypothetical protein
VPGPGGQIVARFFQGVGIVAFLEGAPVNRQTKRFGVILALVAIVSFSAWPLWDWLYVQSADHALVVRTKMLVDKNPQLKADWDQAMADEVLSVPEAKAIVEKAGEKVED